jgi:hypothetical protein
MISGFDCAVCDQARCGVRACRGSAYPCRWQSTRWRDPEKSREAHHCPTTSRRRLVVGVIILIGGTPAHKSDEREIDERGLAVTEGATPWLAAPVLWRVPPSQLIRLDAYLSDNDLDGLMQAVDVVFLPYRQGWNSGAALRGLSNHVRIVGSDLPVFQELAREVSQKWVSTFSANLLSGSCRNGLSEVLERIACIDLREEDFEYLRRYLDQVAFDRSARKIRDLYKRVLQR